MSDGDEFYSGLCDVHLQTQEFMQKEIYRLRRENKALVKRLAETPATATDLQDQASLLERRLLASETERADYRKALDAILSVDDEAESFALAHQAITPYTEWAAVEAPPVFP